MGKLGKTFALTLIITIALSCLTLVMVKPASAQSPSSPSVPVFTLSGGDASAITLTITNQPFKPYYDASSGNDVFLYYNVRIKYSSYQNWTILYRTEDVPRQSNSTLTVLTFPLNSIENANPSVNEYEFGDKLWNVPSGSQLDFQSEAMIGYIYRIDNATAGYPYAFSGNVSVWSSTKTLTIGEVTSLPTITPTPTVPEFSWLLVMPLLLFIFFVAVVAVIVRHRKTANFGK